MEGLKGAGQVVPGKQGQIAQEINALAKCIERCDKSVSLHLEKIQHILGTEPPKEAPGDVAKEETLCSLAEAIRELRYQLQKGTLNRLDSISSRVEI